MKRVNVYKGLNRTYATKHMLGNELRRTELSRIAYDPSKRIPMVRLLPGPASSHADRSLTSKEQGRSMESVFTTINKLAKGKLSLGAKVLQLVRTEKMFRQVFSVREGEKLLKASKCCLYTTTGPVAGRLFISTDKLAFCSDKPIARFTSPSGQSLSFNYKVVIPLGKIKTVNQNGSVEKPSQKYLHVVTTDDFQFWFMGFANCWKTFKYLQQAVPQNPSLIS